MPDSSAYRKAGESNLWNECSWHWHHCSGGKTFARAHLHRLWVLSCEGYNGTQNGFTSWRCSKRWIETHSNTLKHIETWFTACFHCLRQAMKRSQCCWPDLSTWGCWLLNGSAFQQKQQTPRTYTMAAERSRKQTEASAWGSLKTYVSVGISQHFHSEHICQRWA